MVRSDWWFLDKVVFNCRYYCIINTFILVVATHTLITSLLPLGLKKFLPSMTSHNSPLLCQIGVIPVTMSTALWHNNGLLCDVTCLLAVQTAT